MWELSINKQHHADHDSYASMQALIPRLSSGNEEVGDYGLLHVLNPWDEDMLGANGTLIENSQHAIQGMGMCRTEGNIK
jgi:hypothetical protein